MTQDEIDDLIDQWHENGQTSMPLYEFLGWTNEEFDQYVRTGKAPKGDRRPRGMRRRFRRRR